jgi:hypothetical protein
MDPASCGADLGATCRNTIIVRTVHPNFRGWARVASCAANRKRHGVGGDADGEAAVHAQEADHDVGRRGVVCSPAPPSTAVHGSCRTGSSSDPF